MRMVPYTFVIQVQAADGWRGITSYPFDPKVDAGRAGSRERALRAARIGRHAWAQYHQFQGCVLRIAECVLDDRAGAKWVEVAS